MLWNTELLHKLDLQTYIYILHNFIKNVQGSYQSIDFQSLALKPYLNEYGILQIYPYLSKLTAFFPQSPWNGVKMLVDFPGCDS